MKVEELKQSLKVEIKPCYIINGGESYLTQMAVKLIENAINFSFVDINKNVFFDNTQKSAKDIVEACEELPFCDNKRLIIVHDYINKKNEQEKKIFSNYLKKPNPYTCLVFYSTNKSDFFTSLQKESNACVIECEKLSNFVFNSIVDNEIKKLQLKFTPSSLNMLKDYCNYSITKIITELNKFKTIFSTDNLIRDNDVENYVVKDVEYAIFDLTNAISKKDKEKVFILTDNMLKNKEQPITIISLISNHFRRLFLIARSNFAEKDLSEMLGVKEFAIIKYREQVKNFSVKKLKEIFDLCVEVEFKCKSGKMEAKNGLYFLISSILN